MDSAQPSASVAPPKPNATKPKHTKMASENSRSARWKQNQSHSKTNGTQPAPSATATTTTTSTNANPSAAAAPQPKTKPKPAPAHQQQAPIRTQPKQQTHGGGGGGGGRGGYQSPAAGVDPLVADVEAFLRSRDPRQPTAQLIRELMQLLQRPDELTWRMLEAVRHDLVHALDACFDGAASRPFGDRIDLHPFGSAISMLSFRDSDFDILLHLPTSLANSDNIAGRIRAVARQMRTRNSPFGRIVPITAARVPIIKALHRPTGIECDFSFSRCYAGVSNTFVVRHLTGWDARVKPLFMLLKLWCRCHGYLGTGKITSYCLFMLLVFYLQHQPPAILPPLAHFQRTVAEHLMDGLWNIAFDFELRPPPARNAAGLLQLLGGFFEFYADFDFARTVVCTLTGRAYERDAFERPARPMPGLELYDRARRLATAPDADDAIAHAGRELPKKQPMCVQDPFVLNLNAGQCGRAVFEEFRAHLRRMRCGGGGGGRRPAVDGDNGGPNAQLSAPVFLLQLYRPVNVLRDCKRRSELFRWLPTDEQLAVCRKHLLQTAACGSAGAGGGETPDDGLLRAVWLVCVRQFVRWMLEEIAGANINALAMDTDRSDAMTLKRQLLRRQAARQRKQQKTNAKAKAKAKANAKLAAATTTTKSTEKDESQQTDAGVHKIDSDASTTATMAMTSAEVEVKLDAAIDAIVASEDGGTDRNNDKHVGEVDDDAAVDGGDNNSDDVSKAADPFSELFYVFVEHNVFRQGNKIRRCEASTTLQQERQLAKELRLAAAAEEDVAATNVAKYENHTHRGAHVEFLFSSCTGNTNNSDANRGAEQLPVDCSEAQMLFVYMMPQKEPPGTFVHGLLSWFDANGRAYLGKYFDALDGGNVRLDIDVGKLTLLASKTES